VWRRTIEALGGSRSTRMRGERCAQCCVLAILARMRWSLVVIVLAACSGRGSTPPPPPSSSMGAKELVVGARRQLGVPSYPVQQRAEPAIVEGLDDIVELVSGAFRTYALWCARYRSALQARA
jgi:hypothetical protein